VACIINPLYLFAGGVSGVVLDDKGHPVEHAVLRLTPIDQPAAVAPGSAGTAVITQKGRQFIPYVLPVAAGASVSFPNQDDILHHVYSFAEAKRFEINLYAGTPSEPIVFDKPGIVPLGCNIHDWMLAYIYVSDTPYFTSSSREGTLTIDKVPEGKYRAQIWHPRLKGSPEAYDQLLTLQKDSALQIEFNLSLKRDRRRIPPDEFSNDY